MMYDPGLGTFITRDPIKSSPNLYEYCDDRPLDHTDPSGEGGLNGLMYLAQQKEHEHLANVLKKTDSQSAKYAYYQPAGVKDFISKLIALVTEKYVGQIFAPDLIPSAGGWSTTTHAMSFEANLDKISPTIIIHEMTHALDQKNGWNLGIFNRPEAKRSSEDLAYGVQHLFANVYMLEKFEDDVKGGKYKTPAQVLQGWNTAWRQLASFANTPVFVAGEDKGPVTNAMILNVSKKTGLTFSYKKLAPEYQKIVDKYISPPAKLVKPANLPTAFD